MKYIIPIVALGLLAACTKTELAPQFHLPPAPSVLFEQPGKLQTITPPSNEKPKL